MLWIFRLWGEKSVKTFIRGGRLNFKCVLILYLEGIVGKYVLHCNDIDPFVMLMGNFNWGPISHNDIISTAAPADLNAHRLRSLFMQHQQF